MDGELATLVHGKQEWHVRASTLQNCSAVIDTMFRDCDDTQPRVIHMNDVLKCNVEAFLHVAKLTSYDSKMDFPTLTTLSSLTENAMPLVHKYDCTALLRILQSVQNQQPNVKGIMSIVKHEPESIHWMNASSLLCLFKYVVSGNRNQCERKMRELPPALQSKLFTYVMYELLPNVSRSSRSFRDLVI